MHGRLVEMLGAGIALGHVHGTLDPDRIARHFCVSRSVVREALRTLAAKGMVVARQRTGTRVTDPSQWATLDEQVIRWRAAGAERFTQMQDSLDIRSRLEPLAARRMAERGHPAAIEELVAAARMIELATRTKDGPGMLVADTAFHRALFMGSGNAMLAKLAGTVHACLRVPDFQQFQRFSAGTAQRHHQLAQAVAAGLPDEAERVAADVIAITVELFTDAHRQLCGPSAPTGRPPA
ncbi:FadR/GntR family transcriptional regulator [Nocardioides gansuensis]|nr:FCD domain-containing protein [Nocardioides gansuensis]